MTLNAFKDWSLKQGSVAKYDDGQYMGECVSLINQLCWRVLNVPAGAWGHAKDWATNANVRKYFNLVNTIQAGDILVYGGTKSNPYGHIEIALSGGQALGQNRRLDGRVRVESMIVRPIAILRSKTSTGGKTVDRTDLDNIYLYGPLGRKRQKGEGEDVYLGKTAAFVLADHAKSKQGKERAAALAAQAKAAQRVPGLESELKKLKAQPAPTNATSLDQETKDAVKETNQLVKAIKALLERIFK